MHTKHVAEGPDPRCWAFLYLRWARDWGGEGRSWRLISPYRFFKFASQATKPVDECRGVGWRIIVCDTELGCSDKG